MADVEDDIVDKVDKVDLESALAWEGGVMPKTLGFMGLELPKVTTDDVHRFDQAARIKDPAAFALMLDELIREKVASAERAASGGDRSAQLAEKASALRSTSRWRPSGTDIQRGRRALLEAFERPGNLPLPEFARLAHKSRQQIYKDLGTSPRRLLALGVGPRRQRLPDWQLDPLRLKLTQEVLKRAGDVDAWTVYHALSEPAESLRGRSPVDAVTPANLDEVVATVCGILGVHRF